MAQQIVYTGKCSICNLEEYIFCYLGGRLLYMCPPRSFIYFRSSVYLFYARLKMYNWCLFNYDCRTEFSQVLLLIFKFILKIALTCWWSDSLNFFVRREIEFNNLLVKYSTTDPYLAHWPIYHYISYSFFSYVWLNSVKNICVVMDHRASQILIFWATISVPLFLLSLPFFPM